MIAGRLRNGVVRRAEVARLKSMPVLFELCISVPGTVKGGHHVFEQARNVGRHIPSATFLRLDLMEYSRTAIAFVEAPADSDWSPMRKLGWSVVRASVTTVDRQDPTRATTGSAERFAQCDGR